MTENDIAKVVVDAAFHIHRELGPGVLESVYEAIMEYELTKTHGLKVVRQKGIPVVWKEMRLDVGFRADLLVEDKIIVELKSVETIPPVYLKQALTHLKLTKLRLGLLINFNEALLKNGIRRVANGL